MSLTQDAVSGGALVLYQSENGYRFGLDAILLATDLPQLITKPHIVDLGAGNGVAGLCIATRLEHSKVFCVELQESLYALLLRNIARHDLLHQAIAIKADVKNLKALPAHTADLVICNPPFYKVGQGKKSPSIERRLAHHEIGTQLRHFIAAAQYTSKPNGFFKLVLPPFRLEDVFEIVNDTDFGIQSLRFIHARADREAYLVEILMKRGSRSPLEVRPALVIHEGDQFSSEVKERFDNAAVPR